MPRDTDSICTFPQFNSFNQKLMASEVNNQNPDWQQHHPQKILKIKITNPSKKSNNIICDKTNDNPLFPFSIVCQGHTCNFMTSKQFLLSFLSRRHCSLYFSQIFMNFFYVLFRQFFRDNAVNLAMVFYFVKYHCLWKRLNVFKGDCELQSKTFIFE